MRLRRAAMKEDVWRCSYLTESPGAAHLRTWCNHCSGSGRKSAIPAHYATIKDVTSREGTRRLRGL